MERLTMDENTEISNSVVLIPKQDSDIIHTNSQGSGNIVEEGVGKSVGAGGWGGVQEMLSLGCDTAGGFVNFLMVSTVVQKLNSGQAWHS